MYPLEGVCDHPTTILSYCTVHLEKSAAAVECLQDPDLTRRVAFFFFGSGGTWDALAEGSQADCWLLGLIGSASLPTMGLNSWDGT